MKQTMIILFILALIGCDRPQTKEVNGFWCSNVDIVKFNGHEYLCISGYTSGVVHSESCPCKSNNIENFKTE